MTLSSINTAFRAAGAALLLTGALCAAEWPLTGPLIAHDPTMVREGDTWWCFYTGAGLPCKTSTDGITWTQKPNLFSQENSWWRNHAPEMGAIDTWAPDIHHFGGRYWLYYSVSEFGKNNSAIGLMSCTSLAVGDWRDDGLVISSKHGKTPYNAIDPGLVIDADGKPWLSFGSWFIGICLVPLDPVTMKPNGEVRTLAHRENGIEGPNISYHDGYYYLFVAIDRCCQGAASTYKSTYGRSRSILGPYLDKEGRDMIAGGGTVLEVGGERWKGPGGGSVVQNGSSWFFARHAYDTQAEGRPFLRIADLYWDADGWPTLTQPQQSPEAPGARAAEACTSSPKPVN